MRATLALADVGSACSARKPRSRTGDPFVHDVRPGPGVSSSRMLSTYLDGLAKTPGDTRVYLLEGKEPGGTAVVLGGTHGNEIAGIMAATVLVERARVAKGRLIVIPNANNSAVELHGSAEAWARRGSPSRHRAARDVSSTVRGARTPDTRARLTRRSTRTPHLPRPSTATRVATSTAPILARPTVRSPSGSPRRSSELVKDERADLVFDLHEAGPSPAWRG